MSDNFSGTGPEGRFHEFLEEGRFMIQRSTTDGAYVFTHASLIHSQELMTSNGLKLPAEELFMPQPQPVVVQSKVVITMLHWLTLRKAPE